MYTFFTYQKIKKRACSDQLTKVVMRVLPQWEEGCVTTLRTAAKETILPFNAMYLKIFKSDVIRPWPTLKVKMTRITEKKNRRPTYFTILPSSGRS